MPEEQYQCV